MTKRSPKISVIIPTLNEAVYISRLLMYLQEHSPAQNIKEIIVVDGGSSDDTAEIASDYGAIVMHSSKGRAKQMNYGARKAKGQILYFLHADTFPPKKFDSSILKAVAQNHTAGCFRMKFDSNSTFLKFFASLTAFNHKICRGGDQSLFVTQSLFQKMCGFNENYLIFEDSEFIGRLYEVTKFKVLPQNVITSARKYEKCGTLRLQYHFGMIHLKNILGAGPDQLYDYYNSKIALRTQYSSLE